MFVRTLKKITENPYLNILVGILFLYAGASEAWHELQEVEEVSVGAHHGVILFALLNILKTIPEFFEGLEHLQKQRRAAGHNSGVAAVDCAFFDTL